MRKTVLSVDQIMGRAPISREEFAHAVEVSEEDIRQGRYIKIPRTRAEIREFLGKDEKVRSYRGFRSRARA